MSAVVLCVFKNFILNWGMMTFTRNVLVAVSFLSHAIVTTQWQEPYELCENG